MRSSVNPKSDIREIMKSHFSGFNPSLFRWSTSLYSATISSFNNGMTFPENTASITRAVAES